MTTIAWRAGVVASDSQATCGDTRSKTTKLFLLPRQIVGFCGHLGFGLIFVDWLRRGALKKTKPEWKDTIAEVSFSALVLDEAGCALWDEYLQPIPIEDQFAAIGSGSDVAYGAFHMGATATEAIEAAVRFNVGTGSPVVSYSLKDLAAASSASRRARLKSR